LWSTYVQALGRKFLRPDVFRKEDNLTVQGPGPLTLTAKAGSDEEK
jgi:hypothetical protein